MVNDSTTPPLRITIASCVGGGPMERLAAALAQRGHDAVVFSQYSPQRWRQLMSSPLGRVRARLGAMIAFPFRLMMHATFAGKRVQVPTTSPFFLPFMLIMKRWIHRCPVVPLVYDLYPDAVEAAGLSRRTGPLGTLMAKANRWWFRRADAVVFIGEHMGEHARERYGEPPRWQVIETGASMEEFAPRRLDTLDPDPDLRNWCEGKLIISYVGNLGHVHDWDTLALGLQQGLRQQMDQPLGLVIAGSGPGVVRLRETLAGMPEQLVRFQPPLDDVTWAWLLTASDIALASLRDSAAQTSIPSKTFSAMAAGNAILAVTPAASDLAAVVEAHRCGQVVPPGEVETFSRALDHLIHDVSARQTCQDNARLAVRNRYDMPRLAERWEALVRAVTRQQ